MYCPNLDHVSVFHADLPLNNEVRFLNMLAAPYQGLSFGIVHMCIQLPARVRQQLLHEDTDSRHVTQHAQM